MSKDAFEPIKITGCDENKVRRNSGKKGTHIFPFSLSAKPPSAWIDIFEDIWRSHRKVSGKPKPDAYFKKGNLVIECPIDDLKVHFANLQADVETANKAHSEHLQAKAEKNEKKRRKREEGEIAEQRAIRDALATLEFS